jgi:hypothetical protein
VKRKDSALGHKVMHNGKNSLLHFTSVFGSKDNHLLLVKVEGDRGGGGHAGGVTIGRELAGVVNSEVRLAKISKFGSGGTDKHVVHEQGVVSTGTYDSNLDAVLGVPA